MMPPRSLSYNSFLRLLTVSIVLMVVPFFVSDFFYYEILILWMINSIICVGLNFLIGYAGQISLGHAGFFGLSAYLTAVLSDRYDWPDLISMGAAVVIVSVFGYLLAKPIFKLKGYYLAMSTLGIGLIIFFILRNESEFTGGPDGMIVDAFQLWGFEISEPRHWYWITTVFLLICLWGGYNLFRSSFGRCLRGLHDSEMAVQSVGLDIVRMKNLVFTCSVAIVAFAGSFYVFYTGFISPQEANFSHSIELVAMVVVGGMGNIYGGVLGALFFTSLPQFLVFFEEYEILIFGCTIVLVMFFFPNGLAGMLGSVENGLKNFLLKILRFRNIKE